MRGWADRGEGGGGGGMRARCNTIEETGLTSSLKHVSMGRVHVVVLAGSGRTRARGLASSAPHHREDERVSMHARGGGGEGALLNRRI